MSIGFKNRRVSVYWKGKYLGMVCFKQSSIYIYSIELYFEELFLNYFKLINIRKCNRF